MSDGANRSQHPTIMLGKIIRNYFFTTDKPIQLKYDESKTEKCFQKIEKQLRKFKAASDDIISGYSKGIDEITKEVIEDYRLEIIQSALSEGIKAAYDDEVDSTKLVPLTPPRNY